MKEAMKTIYFFTNIVAPYQIENCMEINERKNCEFKIFCYASSEADRPAYWMQNVSKNYAKIMNGPIEFLKQSLSIALNQQSTVNILVGGFRPFFPFIFWVIASLFSKFNVSVYLEKPLPRGPIRSKLREIFLSSIFYVFKKVKVLSIGYGAHSYYSSIGARSAPFIYLLNYTRFSAINKDNIIDSRRRKVLYSGRLSEQHNSEQILNAFILLADKYKNIDFVISSTLISYKYKDMLNTKSSNLIIDDCVYKSWAETSTLYADCDLVVVCLRHSGWSYVLQEAIASGVPVLYSRQVEAANWFSRLGQIGCESEMDSDSIVDAISHLASNPRTWDELIEKVKKFRLNLSYEKDLHQFVDLISENSTTNS
jgi:glycosyltransferase involved in cell wall biosynthesis